MKRGLLIVGGGAAGTAAAVAARQRGMDTVLVEPGRGFPRSLFLGALSTELAREPLVRDRGAALRPAYERAVRRAGEIAAALLDRRDRLLAHLGVARLGGVATLTGRPGEVRIAVGADAEVVEAADVLLASGSRPHVPAPARVDADAVAAAADLLDELEPPRTAIVVGGGREGVALAGLLASAGSSVTLVEAAPRILPRADEDVSAAVGRMLGQAGARVLTGRQVAAVTLTDAGPTVELAGAGAREALHADRVFVAAGRRPRLDDLGLAGFGIEQDLPLPAQQYRSRVPWLLLAGTVTGRLLNAEAARREGRAAVAQVAGDTEHVPHAAVPTLVSGAGGCGWSGLTEKEARAAGHVLLVGRAPLTGSGSRPPGFVKLIADRGSNRVLGVHVVGGQGREAVALGAAAVELGWSRLDLAALAFPTGSPADALVEAAARAEAG